jgi:hypothetical protein
LGGIVLKPGRGGAQEFGRRCEIPIAFLRPHMAEIDGEVREQSLHVGTLLIPAPDTLNSEGMP